MTETRTHRFLSMIALPLMILCAGTAIGNGLPLITFGPDAERQKGNDGSNALVQIQIPRSFSQSLYLRVFDPDVGGTEDEPVGPWNTRIRYSLYGAGNTDPIANRPVAGVPLSPPPGATVVLDAEFGADPLTDGSWHTLGSFSPAQGQVVGGDYVFTLLAEGLVGNDGNLFDVAVSTDPDADQPVSGAELWNNRPSFIVPPGTNRFAEARFVIPAGTTELNVRTFDLDRVRSVLQLPFTPAKSLSTSSDGRWREDTMAIDPSTDGQPGAVVIRGMGSLRNNVVLEVTDQEGKALSFRLPVQHVPEGSPPHPVADYEIQSDCHTLIFDAGRSSDNEDSLLGYQWDFGDQQEASGERTEHRYADAGTYSVVLTVVDDSGRVADRARRTYAVKVNHPPEPVPGHPQVAAPGEQVRFDARASRDTDGKITGFRWTFGDGHAAEGARVSHAYAEPGLYSVALWVKDDDLGPCRTAETATEIWINAHPIAVAGVDRNIAVGETLAFDARNSRDPDGQLKTFHWDFGDGHEASGNAVEHRYSAAGRYRVDLTVEDNAGASNSGSVDRMTVTVNDPPLAEIAGDKRGAVGEELTFDASDSRDPDGHLVDYAWDFGDGNRGNGVAVSHAYAAPGRYLVTLTVRDDSGTRSETDTTQSPVVVNQPPIADAGGDQLVTVSEVLFDARRSYDSDGEILTWQWDFGDGTSGAGPRPRHAYTAPGRYQVVLSVTDDSETVSAEARDTITVVINAKPVADAGPNRTAVPGQNLTVDGSASFDPDGTISDYRWDFGDNSAGQGVTVEHVYDEPGLYQVHLQVLDDSGHHQAVDFVDALIRINAPPIAIAGEDILAAPEQVIVLDASASHDPDGEIASYRWTFSDGQIFTNGPRVQRSFPQPGSFSAVLEVTDDSGAANGRDQDPLAIRINHSPVAVPGDQINSCSQWVELDGRASHDADGDRLQFSWTFGDGGPPAHGPQVLHQFAKAGHYPVVLTVDDGSGTSNATATASTSVRVHHAPLAVAEGPELACAGDVLLFNGAKSYDPDGGRLLYDWDFGDGSGDRISCPAKSYDLPGDYSVSLRVEDESGLPCNSDQEQIAVTVGDAPVADAGPDLTLCANTPVTFDGTASRDFDGVVNSYAWDFGDGGKGGGPNPTHIFTETGEYRVTLTISGDQIGNCASRNSDEILVRVLAAPRVAVEAPSRGPLGEKILFNAVSAAVDGEHSATDLTYRWEFDDGTSDEGEQVERSYDNAGRYLVTLTAEDPQGGECSQMRIKHPVLINAPPIAVAGENREVAPGEAIMFDGSASVDPDGILTHYRWDFGDGEQADGIQVEHRYDEPGSYVVSLTVTDNSGLKNGRHGARQIISVNARPLARFERTPDVPCRDEEVVFDATRSLDPDGTLRDWHWDFGDGDEARGAEVQHRFRAEGLYTTVLTIADGGAVPNSRSRLAREIRVNDPPTAIIDAPLGGCPGEPIGYDASRSTDRDGSVRSYHWTFGDGSDAQGREASRIYAQAGRYRVTLSVTDESDSACNIGQTSIEANINAPPTASIRIPDEPLFLGGAHDGVLFDGTGSTDPDGDLLTYYWDFGDGTKGQGPKVVHVYDTAGRYNAKLKVQDNSGTGCDSGTDQVDLNIRQRPRSQH